MFTVIFVEDNVCKLEKSLKAINKANWILGMMKISFLYLNKPVVLRLYKSLV